MQKIQESESGAYEKYLALQKDADEEYLCFLKVFKEELLNFEVILNYLQHLCKPTSTFEEKHSKRKEDNKE